MVSQSQGFGEIVHQSFCPGVSVGLENTPELFMRIILCRMERCLDLGGMVCVIVNDGHLTDGSFFLKAAFGAAEFVQAVTNRLHRDGKDIGQNDGSQSVVYIVNTRYIQGEMAKESVSFFAVKGRMAKFVICDIFCVIVTGGIRTVGDRLGGQTGCKFIQTVDLLADDQCAVLWKKFCETAEGMADVFQVFKEIQMVCINV